MRPLDIRTRLLLAALLPVVIVSLLLAGVFLLARSDDMHDAYQERARSVVRQLARSSEYGLFAANQSQLQALVRGALREPDLRGLAVLDSRGQLMASAGDLSGTNLLSLGAQEVRVFDPGNELDLLAQPVFASGLALDPLYEDASTQADMQILQLGQIRAVFTRQTVDERRHSMLWLGVLVSALGLLFGLGLALQLSRGVMRPIKRVSNLIERIGQGDFAAALESPEPTLMGDPFKRLQDNLGQMATRLASARDDLTQQVQEATQALRLKKEEAEQATQAKSRFLASASHDLRQPTHALGMFVTRLAQLPHDEPTCQLIANLESSVRAMQNLLDGLMDISRLEAQSVQVTLRPLALANLMDQLAQDLGQTALDKDLRFRVKSNTAWVLSDGMLLYRILLNLVGNALRYTERGGVLVACRWVQQRSQVQIQVWDTGIGIAPEHQQAVFREFYQVDNVARDRLKGMGIGLSIVQRTADLLGHGLTMDSVPGQGTRFTLTLPVVPASPMPAISVTDATYADTLAGAHVLVIEDDELVRVALVGLLQGWGVQVHQAGGLADARQLLTDGVSPQLILSDYRLQGEHHGIAVVQQLRLRLNQHVPACLMSGDTDSALVGAAQEADLYLLHKPVRPAKLRALLRRLLSGQALEDDLR